MARIFGKDLKIVSLQLQRTPKNAEKIVLRCSKGYPTVVKSSPVLDGKPFPTLYWLTCPFLRYKISQFESEGYIARYESMLMISSEMRFKENLAHIRARDEILSEVKEKWIREKMASRGMGGIEDFSHIKCLHLHVAYHLGGIENPVAELILKEIGRLECEENWCQKYEEVIKIGMHSCDR